MHIESISAVISPEALNSFLRAASFPEGITLVDWILGDGAIILVLRMASYFAIPVRVKLELDSYKGSKIVFRATPPVRFSIADALEISDPGAAQGALHARYTLAEMDLAKVSKGIIRTATIRNLSIGRNGISIRVENLELDPQKILALWKTL